MQIKQNISPYKQQNRNDRISFEILNKQTE